jgi:hypothetical protein
VTWAMACLIMRCQQVAFVCVAFLSADAINAVVKDDGRRRIVESALSPSRFSWYLPESRSRVRYDTFRVDASGYNVISLQRASC